MRDLLLAIGGVTLLGAAAHATADDLRSVAGMQSHNRVLLAFAPSLKDPRLERQRQSLGRLGLQAAERDLILVQVSDSAVLGAHDDAGKLRRRFKVPPPAYRTLLIGKDGNVAFQSPGPIAGAEIMQRIDAMPMRRAEIRRAHAGQPRPAS